MMDGICSCRCLYNKPPSSKVFFNKNLVEPNKDTRAHMRTSEHRFAKMLALAL